MIIAAKQDEGEVLPYDLSQKVQQLEDQLRSQVGVHEELLRQLNAVRDSIVRQVLEEKRKKQPLEDIEGGERK